MTNTYLIGVDIGTQGTKAALYRVDGKLMAEGFEKSNLLIPRPGAVEQDPEDLYGSVLRTIRDIMQKSGVTPEEVAAIGIDGQMAGILGIDAGWNAVTPYDSWLDTRCEPYIRFMKERAEDTIISTTGGQVTYAHGPKVLWWKQERPEVYKKIAKFIMPTTYVAGRLCGLKADSAYLDDTYLHFSGFADIRRREWSQELLGMFDVAEEKMPRICRPSDIIGKLTSEAASACGLAVNTPVVAGCGDSAASSLGAGITGPGVIYDVAGTASIFSCSTETFAPDTRHKTILYARSVVEGLWIPLAYISGGGMCLHWFKEMQGENYAALDAAAEAVKPGSEGLLFIPHFAGRTCPNDPSVKGGYLGLNWNHKKAHMYRAIMESIAYEYRFYYDILHENSAVCPTVICGVGGGSGSHVFNQIKADALQLPYCPLKCGDTATFGSAVLAGYGCGIYNDLKAASKLNCLEGQPVMPRMENTAQYSENAKTYATLLDKIGGLYTILFKNAEVNT